MFNTTARIIELKDARKMNTSQFAKLTGISQSYLNQIENGQRHASVAIIEKICNACEISLSDFFAGADNVANIKIAILSREREDLIYRIERLKHELSDIEKRLGE